MDDETIAKLYRLRSPHRRVVFLFFVNLLLFLELFARKDTTKNGLTNVRR